VILLKRDDKERLCSDFTQLVAEPSIDLPLFDIFASFPLNFFAYISFSQIDVVNGLQLLTAKPVTYLVNLSEKDYVRKKNKW